MNEIMWIWMQECVEMPPFFIMLPMDFTGQKRIFPPDETFQLLRGCGQLNTNLFLDVLKLKQFVLHREREDFDFL